MSKFVTGTRLEVLSTMASHAIRDQKSLIDAYTSSYGSPDTEAMKVISDAKKLISDYRLILKECYEKSRNSR
jgi:hypothetical protein